MGKGTKLRVFGGVLPVCLSPVGSLAWVLYFWEAD
jgi:hypothetical protein